MEHVAVAVVGGGQAGLATSFELTRHGIEHLVLERDHVGQTWRDRWDSFCLVTPNWSVQRPAYHYAGAEPAGFMPRQETLAYRARDAKAFRAPVREGVGSAALG